MDILIIALIVLIAITYLVVALINRLKKPSCSCECKQCPMDKQNDCSGKVP